MGNVEQNYKMAIVLPLTILITVVEMNVDCKDVYAKANCAEINVWVGEGGRRGSRATSLCFREVFPQL